MDNREHFTNFRCLLFATGLALAAAAFGAQTGNWTHWITVGIGYGVGIVLMLIAMGLIAKSYFPTGSGPSTTQVSNMVPGIPTLSALLGQNPTSTFNAKQFFALAYYSPITAEVEKNIKEIAQQANPTDKEAFYARFIGVGAVAYHHEISWLTIFGSQIRAMEELNARGLIPIADLKKHYEAGAAESPEFYATYPFEKWIGYMQSRFLIASYPTLMVELSFNGKDFLKYLAHAGWNTHSKPN